ncbi:hypothetical protein [Methylomonas sp. MK1]|uniref:hypothetical protein n=1 Tax=Methylomonas sp. MK1 TaxID=1131552 RepID=UPI00036B25D2|nr:hypothetical protein [Methylomonas sp. MK1]
MGVNDGLMISDFKAGQARQELGNWYIPQSHIDAFVKDTVRVETLPAGFKLFKLTKGEAKSDPKYGITPWWSSVSPFKEDYEGAIGRFEQAKLNKIDMSAMSRYMAAVPIDWNELDNYIEISLKVTASGFWGTFAPQEKWHDKHKQNLAVEMSRGRATPASRTMGIKDAVLPDELGALEAWQFYIPGLQEEHISRENRVISAHDMVALQAYFFA